MAIPLASPLAAALASRSALVTSPWRATCLGEGELHSLSPGMSLPWRTDGLCAARALHCQLRGHLPWATPAVLQLAGTGGTSPARWNLGAFERAGARLGFRAVLVFGGAACVVGSGLPMAW